MADNYKSGTIQGTVKCRKVTIAAAKTKFSKKKTIHMLEFNIKAEP